ncbi:hypothetical protein PR202_gb01316 [Eleusine coracana subsp. coracana]|uniref:Uncharacterized protein n=1 Tax=Eleusine coracana subsp. coracana TaxID=191504 RepID=A0AAV5DWC4_ELECO|nr:hypothetical protein PR202_gb01316 [Eleusine coracana subsp. coracana]
MNERDEELEFREHGPARQRRELRLGWLLWLRFRVLQPARNLSKVNPAATRRVTSGHSQCHGGIDKWVISPLDSRYRCWETFMVLLVVYSAWVYPFEVAFMNAVPKGGLEVVGDDRRRHLFFAVDIEPGPAQLLGTTGRG